MEKSGFILSSKCVGVEAFPGSLETLNQGVLDFK